MSCPATFWRTGALALVLLATGACAPITASGTPPAASPETALRRDLERIMRWWPGDYNNDRQLARLAAEGKPIWRADDSGKGGHIEVTSHYRAVDLPAFGENVIYVEETKHGDPDAIFRQRIYSLTIDEAADTLRVSMWNFKDKEKHVGAWRDLSRLSGLTPAEMTNFGENCDLVMTRKSDEYHLAMQDRQCAFGENYFSYQVLLGEDSFWFRDKIARLADDAPVSIAGDYTYHELDRMGTAPR